METAKVVKKKRSAGLETDKKRYRMVVVIKSTNAYVSGPSGAGELERSDRRELSRCYHRVMADTDEDAAEKAMNDHKSDANRIHISDYVCAKSTEKNRAAYWKPFGGATGSIGKRAREAYERRLAAPENAVAAQPLGVADAVRALVREEVREVIRGMSSANASADADAGSETTTTQKKKKKTRKRDESSETEEDDDSDDDASERKRKRQKKDNGEEKKKNKKKNGEEKKKKKKKKRSAEGRKSKKSGD